MKIRAAVSPALNKLKARVAFFAVAMAVTLGMMNARIGYAQNASQVTVPFAFSANHQVFPAGHYRVSRESDSFLIVRSTDTGVGAGLMVRTMRTLEPTGKNSLVFYHDASGYRLLTVRFAQGGLQTDLSVQPKSEREIAKATAGASTEVGMN
jgi:hypothetical protein